MCPKRDILAVFLIAIIVVLFFLPLFWPEPKLLVTPDFGKSDAWHFSFATKYLLWENLQQGNLPLWTDKIGDGFPILAEGQIGTFFLPNLILFKLTADPVTAYNLSLVATVLILSWGMYAWLRTLNVSPFPGFFGALTFILSGIVILQLPHISLLQGFSLLPWIMTSTELIIFSPSRKTMALFSFLLSQQVFAGFPQATFLTLLVSGGLMLWHVWTKEVKRHHLFTYLGTVLLGFGLSAAQLLPSWEFLKETGITAGLPQYLANYFSFPLVHFKSFFDPFALGDPKMGTYPHFAEFDGSIFWENTGYLGIFPLFLILITLRYRNKITSFFLITLVFSFLLMWGSHSPLYLIYSLWPFNLFRVPSRFLWIFILSLVTLVAMGFQQILKNVQKKSLIAVGVILALANTAYLFFLWRQYHLFVPARVWIKKPLIATLIPKESRVITIGSEKTHNELFLTSGWQKPQSYQALRSSLAPDTSLIWGIAQHDVYAGRVLRRPGIFDTLLTGQIRIGQSEATISAAGQKLLNLMGVTHLISTLPLVMENGLQKPVIYDEQMPNSLEHIRLYANTTATARTYFAHNTVQVNTVEKAIAQFSKDTFIPGKTALVENPLELPNLPAQKETATAEITKSDSRRVTVSTQSTVKALLVLSDTYYPGWNAYLDGGKVPILPVNVRYRGIVVPKGAHTVTFLYEPASFTIGAAISLFSFLIFLTLVASPDFLAASQTQQKVHRHVSHRRRRAKLRLRRVSG